MTRTEVLGLARVRQPLAIRERHSIRIVAVDDEEAFDFRLRRGRRRERDRTPVAQRQRRGRHRTIRAHPHTHARPGRCVDVATVDFRSRREPCKRRIFVAQVDPGDTRRTERRDVELLRADSRSRHDVRERLIDRPEIGSRAAIYGSLQLHGDGSNTLAPAPAGLPDLNHRGSSRERRRRAHETSANRQRLSGADARVARLDNQLNRIGKQPKPRRKPRPLDRRPADDNRDHERRRRGERPPAGPAQQLRRDDVARVDRVRARRRVGQHQRREPASRPGNGRRQAILELGTALFDETCQLSIVRPARGRDSERRRSCDKGEHAAGESEEPTPFREEPSIEDQAEGNRNRRCGGNPARGAQEIEREPAAPYRREQARDRVRQTGTLRRRDLPRRAPRA